MKSPTGKLGWPTLEDLIYEVIDGKPVFYSKAHTVMQELLLVDELKFSESSQPGVLSAISQFLWDNLPEDEYQIFTNGIGYEPDSENHLVLDIAVCDKEKMEGQNLSKALQVAPELVILKDSVAGIDDPTRLLGYFHDKIRKLIDHGTERVIWINTISQLMTVADDDGNWYTVDWEEEIEWINGLEMTLEDMLAESTFFPPRGVAKSDDE
ncbi:MAG: hypothetical protein MRY78_20955 [Saprospiraceae bacterium]|nr:hypothetical protein [Saprospiraceae bacterium]